MTLPVLLQSILFSIQLTAAPAIDAPLALIYRGPGSCPQEVGGTGCSEAAQAVAELAGFRTRFVGPEGLGKSDQHLLQEATVWLQPGGRAKQQILNMTDLAKNQIRNFVAQGGGYVGFCAGGFLATEEFGWIDEENPKNSFQAKGLGLLPGDSRYFDEFDSELTPRYLAKILNTSWLSSPRSIYWELGPYFDYSTTGKGNIESVAFYQTNHGVPRMDRAMTVRGQYGKGRVFVTAVHPEAPQDWYSYYKLTDPDGVDAELAAEMVRWAARKTNSGLIPASP